MKTSYQHMFDSIQNDPQYLPLTAKEELAIIAGNPREIWEELLVQHSLRLPLKFIKRYEKTLDVDELYQECVLAIMKASKTFDETRGTRFSTHASWQIREAISKTLRESIRACDQKMHINNIADLESIEYIAYTCEDNLDTSIFTANELQVYTLYYEERKSIEETRKILKITKKEFNRLRESIMEKARDFF